MCLWLAAQTLASTAGRARAQRRETVAAGSAEDLASLACNILSRNLIQYEWQMYLGDREYSPTCPGLTVPEEKLVP